MKIHSITLLFLTVILSTSCENEIPFNLKDNPPKLVMNALINADSTNNVLYLNLTGRKVSLPVKDAIIEVRVDGHLIETIHAFPVSNSNDFPNQYFITSRFHPGELVRIDARTPDGKHHAWAEVTVPQRPENIERVDTATVALKSGYSNYLTNHMQYKITINDKANELNYYRLIVETTLNYTTLPDEENEEEQKHSYKFYKFINREDVVLTDGEPYTSEDESNGLFDKTRNIYNVFDDSRFRDTRYVMTVYNDLNIYYQKVKDVQIQTVIRLLSITETEFHYLKALNVIDSDAYDETLMEPVKYPGNVNGGVGIVGISTETSYIQNITKKKSD